MTDTSELMSINEAAKAAGVDRTTIYRWMRNGKLHPVKVGGRLMIRKEEIK